MLLTSTANSSGRLVVTTSVAATQKLIDEARMTAVTLGTIYEDRAGRSIESFFDNGPVQRALVIQNDRYTLYSSNGAMYQYHPNMAIVRALNHRKTASEYYLIAAAFKPGDRVIDCTLGFGTEALLAAQAVGSEGEVIGLESVPELALLTRDGMRRYRLLQKDLQDAMRRVVVLNNDYRAYLRQTQTHSADIIYFDPFFEETLAGSATTVDSLAAFGNRAPLDIRAIMDARRIARRSVIVKHPKWMALPKDISCQVKDEVCGRKSSITFAVIPPFGY